MSRSCLLFLGLLTGSLFVAASPGLARGDEDDDERLAKQLVAAAEKYDELQEVTVKHGRRAELALTILQGEQTLAVMNARIQDMNNVIDGFPPRRWWVKDQHDYHQWKVAHETERNALQHDLTGLRFQERQLYEEEMQQAQAKGRPVKPFHREAILNDLQRLNRETKQAMGALKEGIEAAARKQQATRGEILQRASNLARKETSSLAPEALQKFLREFHKSAGGDGWLNAGATKPPQDARHEAPKERPQKQQVDNEALAQTWLRTGDNLKGRNARAARQWYERIIRSCPETEAARIARARLKNSNS
jgi:hypothetical protein